MLDSDLAPWIASWRASADPKGVLYSPDKALARVPSGRTLGYWVNGDAGLVTLPSDSFLDLIPFSAYVLPRSSFVPLNLRQILLGALGAAFDVTAWFNFFVPAMRRDTHASPFV